MPSQRTPWNAWKQRDVIPRPRRRKRPADLRRITVLRRCAERVLDAARQQYGDPPTETRKHQTGFYYSHQPLYPEDFGYKRYEWRPGPRRKAKVISVDELARGLWLVECANNQELRFADCKPHFLRLHRQQFIAILRALIDLQLIEKVKGHSAKHRRAAIYRVSE